MSVEVIYNPIQIRLDVLLTNGEWQIIDFINVRDKSELLFKVISNGIITDVLAIPPTSIVKVVIRNEKNS